jgi:hypothetical protein
LLTDERKILEKFHDAPCPHLPELVWTCKGDKELGIVPIGKPVHLGEPVVISHKIIQGIIKGLRCLHGLWIIH